MKHIKPVKSNTTRRYFLETGNGKHLGNYSENLSKLNIDLYKMCKF